MELTVFSTSHRILGTNTTDGFYCVESQIPQTQVHPLRPLLFPLMLGVVVALLVIREDKRPPKRRRNIKNTNWNTYEDELSAKVNLWFSNITTPADIERELTKVNSAIITSFETACPECRVSGRHKVLVEPRVKGIATKG